MGPCCPPECPASSQNQDCCTIVTVLGREKKAALSSLTCPSDSARTRSAPCTDKFLVAARRQHSLQAPCARPVIMLRGACEACKHETQMKSSLFKHVSASQARNTPTLGTTPMRGPCSHARKRLVAIACVITMGLLAHEAMCDIRDHGTCLLVNENDSQEDTALAVMYRNSLTNRNR